MIESGKYGSSAELAKAEKVNDSYLSRILRLTLLSPDIIEAILTGRQPSTLQLDDLLIPLPAAWDGQRSKLAVRYSRKQLLRARGSRILMYKYHSNRDYKLNRYQSPPSVD